MRITARVRSGGVQDNASRGVKSCRIERDSREPRERVFSLVNAGIAQLVEQLICNLVFAPRSVFAPSHSREHD